MASYGSRRERTFRWEFLDRHPGAYGFDRAAKAQECGYVRTVDGKDRRLTREGVLYPLLSRTPPPLPPLPARCTLFDKVQGPAVVSEARHPVPVLKGTGVEAAFCMDADEGDEEDAVQAVRQELTASEVQAYSLREVRQGRIAVGGAGDLACGASRPTQDAAESDQAFDLIVALDDMYCGSSSRPGSSPQARSPGLGARLLRAGQSFCRTFFL